MPTADAIIKLRELIGDSRVAMVTTGTPGGELHSRPLTLGSVDDDGSLVFLVDKRADWVSGLQHGEAVNASVSNDDDKVWVSMAGRARLGEDRATIDRVWNPAAEAFFDEGIDSPHLRVLTVEVTTVEYWDAPASRVARLAMMASSLLGRANPPGESGSIDMG